MSVIQDYYADATIFRIETNTDCIEQDYYAKRLGLHCTSSTTVPEYRLGQFVYLSKEINQNDAVRILLYKKAYGVFPSVTIPEINRIRLYLLAKELYSYTDIETIKDTAIDSVPEFFDIPNELIKHDILYSVAHFMTCIRHEVLLADFKKNNIRWNPIVSFSNPYYYTKGYFERWWKYNNILKANLIEFIENVYQLMVSAYLCKDKSLSSFLPLQIDNNDINRLCGVKCILNEPAKSLAFNMLENMILGINVFYGMLLRKEIPSFNKKSEKNISDLLVDLFRKIQAMENYVMLL